MQIGCLQGVFQELATARPRHGTLLQRSKPLPRFPHPTLVCSTHEFKYSSFHESNAAARAAADAAVGLAAAERAEREAEKAEKAAAERGKAKGGVGPSVAQRLKQGMERVGEAAAAEAMGASDIQALTGERRLRAALRVREERQRPPGVLYLNERDAQVGAGMARSPFCHGQIAVLPWADRRVACMSSAGITHLAGVWVKLWLTCSDPCLLVHTPQGPPSGVLHIDASRLSMAAGSAAPQQAQAAQRAGVPVGAAAVPLDKGVGAMVENIGRGIM